MPYITPEDKEKFEPEVQSIKDLITSSNFSKGEITYLVYTIAKSSFKRKESYTSISNAISSLIDAAEELRRRYLNPYEDKKIIENGDVI